MRELAHAAAVATRVVRTGGPSTSTALRVNTAMSFGAFVAAAAGFA
ncbi:hypothetical protein [Phytomonospora endophytica]|uniref:Uncharacterized protein n=1 Tax=Phytomonospora endophytica TaxID=714109 RepID=A0A841FKM4_9ACTN|nr:hypothetical protein [Phytomonospora endophytica]MBB6036414.1 hypothetical protein [Phytomonospora endophytica]